jgi:hypothetical protein
MYELDDGFVDDSELYEVFEKQHEAQSILTKYSGFFVNKGELELVGHKEDGEEGGKEKKKRGRKSGGEGGGIGGGGGGGGGAKKPKGGGGGGGEDDENGGGGGGDEGGNGGKVKKAKKQQQQQQQKAGGGGAGDDMSVVSNSSSTMASGGGSVGGSSTSSTSSNKAKGAEMQAAALATFREAVEKWQKEQQQSSSSSSAPPLDELPLPLRPAALALDLVMRRPAGEKKYKSTHPGENGLSSLYIDMLQALLPLGGGGREGGRAWRKGLTEAAVGRVRVLKGLIEESLVEFRRHYDVKKERIAKRASSSSSSSSSSKEGGGEEGGEGGGEGAMPPPKSVVLDMKLKQCMFTLLTSLKERNSVQVLFAGQGREGGAEGGEAEGLLPLVPTKHEEEERKALTTLAEMWPEEGMKIPRLRRAFNDYKGKQQLLQSVNGSAAGAAAAAAAAGGGNGGKVGGVSVLKKVVPKTDVEGGVAAPAHAKLKKKTSSTTTTTIKKKVSVTKKRTGPWKGSFMGLQRIPFNAADFEQEARND